MSILCRLFGHQPSRSRVQRDPKSFEESSICKRCGAALERSGNGWKAR